MRYRTAIAAALFVLLPAGAVLAVGDVSDTLNVVVPGASNTPAEVALRLSRATFADNEASTTLLATSAAFADALASGALQGDAPLLLTGRDDLRADVAAELERLGTDDVVLLGGEAALAPEVEEQLDDLGIDSSRAAGPTRLETAAEVAELAPDPSTVIVARGFSASGDDTQAFADSLAAGGWAAEEGWPILLTHSDELSPATRAALARSDADRVVLLGGEAALAPAVADAIEDLGIDVDRIAGGNRFATAVAIADQRGFDSQEDAARVILVEGQAADAWAGGFAAAAHSAVFDAPILLANGDVLPPETEAFLTQAAFAVETEPITEPVLVCAAAAAACDAARARLGLPAEAVLTLEIDADGVPSGTVLDGTLATEDPVDFVASGNCVEGGTIGRDDDGAFELEIIGPPGPCTLTLEVFFENGTVQTIERELDVTAALPLTGTVTDTATGQDSYTFVPQGADAARTITYTAADGFELGGEPATIGAFEAALTVGDTVTFTQQTEDGGALHELVDVDTATLQAGTVGNVDLAGGTFALVEPVTGVALRSGISFDGSDTYVIGGITATVAQFADDVSEGDEVAFDVSGSTTNFRLINRTAAGAAADVQIDVTIGFARFRAGGLGDDPASAQDELFQAVSGADQLYTVDGNAADFADFAAALSAGDSARYRRSGGTEFFEITNAPPPSLEGVVTERHDPDGSPTAGQEADGGHVTVLTETGRAEITYGPAAAFRLDGAVATEAEVEAALTAGDQLEYQPGDPATDTAEEVALTDLDLEGQISDISEGSDTYDVVIPDGVVYDDLPYTAAIFGGTDRYVINGTEVGLAQFEAELTAVDQGVREATIVVAAAAGTTASGVTEHRLTSVTPD